MFTGIIREVGQIEEFRATSTGTTLRIRCQRLLEELSLGDSVAVDGVCLTVTDVWDRGFAVDVVRETLARSIIHQYRRGTLVNLEPSLRVGDPLGGHIVLGHVDGVVQVTDVRPDGQSRILTLRAPQPLRKFIAEKGSVALNGVSLTVASVADGQFRVALVPFTLRETNLGLVEPGMRLNLEVDVIARYVNRLLSERRGEPEQLTLERLRELGFDS